MLVYKTDAISPSSIAIKGGFVIPVHLSQEDLFGFAEGLNGCVAVITGVAGDRE